jgi:hypothetical protein
MKEYLVHLVGVVKEELDGRNSLWRIREIPRVVRSCRGVGKLRQVFFKCKLRRRSDHRIQVDKGRWITCEFSLQGFTS